MSLSSKRMDGFNPGVAKISGSGSGHLSFSELTNERSDELFSASSSSKKVAYTFWDCSISFRRIDSSIIIDCRILARWKDCHLHDDFLSTSSLIAWASHTIGNNRGSGLLKKTPAYNFRCSIWANYYHQQLYFQVNDMLIASSSRRGANS